MQTVQNGSIPSQVVLQDDYLLPKETPHLIYFEQCSSYLVLRAPMFGTENHITVFYFACWEDLVF